MPEEGANEPPSSDRTDAKDEIEANGADGKVTDGAVEADVAPKGGESGSGRHGAARDLTDASEEEILNVRVRSHGGGGGGGFVVEDMQGGTVSMGGRGGGRRSASATRDLTEGSVPKNLWILAWPQMVEGILNVVDQMADLFWAGRFVGARAIAGLGVAQDYTRLIMTGRMGLDIGMQAMVARAIGAGRVELANHVVLQAFTLTVTFTLVVVTTGAFFTDFLLQVLGVSDEVVAVAGLYMRIQFIGFGAQAFRMMSAGALQAAGDAVTPMKATLLARVTHIFLSPLLFFGIWFFPEMGIAGLAAGNVLAQSLAVVWNFHALFSGNSRLHLTLRGYYMDFPLLGRLLRIGAPATFTGMERSLVSLLMVPMVTPFGDFSLAAYGLTRRLEMFTNLGSMGLGRASGALVGQNLGAGHKGRAKATVLWALGYVTAIRGSIGMLLLIFPAFFIGIFNNEPELMEIAVMWVRIQAIGGLVMGSGMVFQMSFNVAGDTMTPLLVTFVTMVGIQLPLAYVLAYQTSLGQYGIPIAITVAMFSRVFLYIPYYIKGRWLNVKVLD